MVFGGAKLTIDSSRPSGHKAAALAIRSADWRYTAMAWQARFSALGTRWAQIPSLKLTVIPHLKNIVFQQSIFRGREGKYFWISSFLLGQKAYFHGRTVSFLGVYFPWKKNMLYYEKNPKQPRFFSLLRLWGGWISPRTWRWNISIQVILDGSKWLLSKHQIKSWLVNLPPPNVPPARNKGVRRPY